MAIGERGAHRRQVSEESILDHCDLGLRFLQKGRYIRFAQSRGLIRRK
jgi:hypothetical protein